MKSYQSVIGQYRNHVYSLYFCGPDCEFINGTTTSIMIHDMSSSINSLPNNKILDVTKLKAFADDKINAAQMMISVCDRVESIVGKGENSGYQHFLLFSQCFQRASFLGSLKVGILW